MIYLRNHRGFTLVESLVGSAIFVAIALSGYKAFAVLMDGVAVSQAKIAGTSVANEQFEIMRNLPYTDVGIVSGLPLGKIERTKTITKDKYIFNVETAIRSIDDVFDGTIGGSPSDTSPADYKLADLDITCTNCKTPLALNFTTLVAPHALETASTNGALFIRVFDSAGVAVPGASLHIVNTQTEPDTIIDEITDNNGWFRIVDAPVGTNAYTITATKAGFTQENTYAPGGAAGPTPINPNPTVVLQQVTSTSLTIDRTSTLNVSTVDSSCVTLPSIGFSLTGTKLIGTPSVLKYPTNTFSTDLLGQLSIGSLEWDSYSTLLTSGAYDLAGTSLLPSFTLDANEIKNLQLVAVPHIDRALLISVQDSLGNPIDGATVELQKTGFNQNKTTGGGACATAGQAFWNSLSSGFYTLTVSKAGYQDNVSSPQISAPWQAVTVTLVP